MHLWKEGDRSAAVCERCRKRVATRFEYRTFGLSKPKVDVPDVLVAVCEECGEVAGIPHQSTPKIREARRRDLIKFGARVPLQLQGALGLVAARYEARPEAFSAPLIRFYLREVGRDAGAAALVRDLARDPIARGRRRGRISVGVDKRLWDDAWRNAQGAGIRDRSELARGLLVAAALDAGLGRVGTAARRASPRRRRTLEAIANTV
jgi:hypothetical protein